MLEFHWELDREQFQERRGTKRPLLSLLASMWNLAKDQTVGPPLDHNKPAHRTKVRFSFSLELELNGPQPTQGADGCPLHFHLPPVPHPLLVPRCAA